LSREKGRCLVRLDRRLVAAVASVAVLLAACADDDPDDPTVDGDATDDEAATADADLSDTQLTLLIHPTLYAAMGGDEGLVAEFREETGATIDVVTADVAEYIERAMVEFATGSGRFDVIAMENSHLSEEVLPHLHDLSPYIEAAPADWDYEDFPASLRDPVTLEDGSVIGIPYRFAANAMYYRADLFEEAGVEAPETFDEMLAVAREVEDATGVTPWVQRGVDEEITHDWLNFLYGYGGQVLTDDLQQCAIASDAGVAATELFRELYEESLVPDDLFSITRDDYIARMQRGDVAAGIYYAPYWGNLVDADESDVADDMAFALQPTGDGVEPGRTRAAGWYLSIADDSQNPAAAWDLVQFITNEENLLRGALDWANAPVRLSTYEHPDFVERFPVAEVWSEALEASVLDPAVPGTPQIVDIISEEVVGDVRGDRSASEAMDAACQRIDEVIS
jgi:multiple sugar transport system substrate-binding protein